MECQACLDAPGTSAGAEVRCDCVLENTKSVSIQKSDE